MVEVVVDSREAGFEGHGEGDQRLLLVEME